MQHDYKGVLEKIQAWAHVHKEPRHGFDSLIEVETLEAALLLAQDEELLRLAAALKVMSVKCEQGIKYIAVNSDGKFLALAEKFTPEEEAEIHKYLGYAFVKKSRTDKAMINAVKEE